MTKLSGWNYLHLILLSKKNQTEISKYMYALLKLKIITLSMICKWSDLAVIILLTLYCFREWQNKKNLYTVLLLALSVLAL